MTKQALGSPKYTVPYIKMYSTMNFGSYCFPYLLGILLLSLLLPLPPAGHRLGRSCSSSPAPGRPAGLGSLFRRRRRLWVSDDDDGAALLPAAAGVVVGGALPIMEVNDCRRGLKME